MNDAMQYLEPMTADETHAECMDRVRQEGRYQLHPQPEDHDAHVTGWRVAMWEQIEEKAWLSRQAAALMNDR